IYNNSDTVLCSFFAAIQGSVPAEKRPEKGMRGWRWEKDGEGAPLFPTDRTPSIFIRSLFGSGIVKFGITA
ncbi:MAG: hypothetical protein LBL28_07525, partial [Treponema sp.]|nr:hypothetical protein [Treponema sp.]